MVPSIETNCNPVLNPSHAISPFYLHSQGKESQYSFENVCVVPGGRAGLTRVMAALGSVQVGYFTPDYTAYQEALGLFTRITPSPLLHLKMNEALMSSEEFRFQASGRGLGAMLLSNPANPTGQSLEGEELKNYVDIARELGIALLMDEFYSHYYVSTWSLKIPLIFFRSEERRWLTTPFLIFHGPNLTHIKV